MRTTARPKQARRRAGARSASARKGATKQAVAGKDKPRSYDLILDAAEKLFAEYAYSSVSLRDIAGLAKVNLGLTFYHFRSKEALFEHVIVRRIGPMSQARRAALAKVQARKNHGIAELVDAFMRPIFDALHQ